MKKEEKRKTLEKLKRVTFKCDVGGYGEEEKKGEVVVSVQWQQENEEKDCFMCLAACVGWLRWELLFG